jgi:hypothetical protein
MSDLHDKSPTAQRAFELHGARIGVRLVGIEGEAADALLAEALPVGARWIQPERLHHLCEHVAGPSASADDLSAVLDFAAAAHATERVVLHAGVVEWEGRAILIPGRSLSGKTTLTAALVRAGATFYSDEFAPIDREGRVWPHARPLSVRAPGSTAPGRPVPVEDLGAQAGTEPMPVGLVVDTRHVAGATWRPTRLDAGAGLLRILDNAVVAQTAPDLALSFLAPIVASAPVLASQRGDADETAAKILMAASRAGATDGRTVGRTGSAMIAFEVPPGEGLGPIRHLLIRMVLAARHATAVRRAVQPSAVGLGLALAALAPPPATSTDAPCAEPLRWSSLYDLPRLAAGCGLLVADLDDVADPDREMPWDRLELIPPSPPQASDEVWVPEGSTRRVRASCGPDARALADALWPEADGTVGVRVTGADQIGWGASYASPDFWSIVDAMRPAAPILELASRQRPPGAYLGVHWRRGSYAVMKPEVSPGPPIAAQQIAAVARSRGLAVVAVATDADAEEVAALKRELARIDRDLVISVLGGAASEDVPAFVQSLAEQVVMVESTWFVGTRGSSWTAAVREGRVASGEWTPEATWSVFAGDPHDAGNVDDEELGPIWELPARHR